MNLTTERTFEAALVESLTEQGGYNEGNSLPTENRTALVSEVVTVR